MFGIKLTIEEKQSTKKTNKSLAHVPLLVSLPTASSEVAQITCYDHPSRPGLQAGPE